MLDQTQLDHFRERQLLSLMDTCHRLVYSRTFNDLNEPIEVWTENTTDIPCGLNPQAGRELHRDKDTIISYDAIIRLPLDTVLDEKDKLRITKRFGTAVTVIDYAIISPAQIGPSGIRYLLNKTTL